MEDSGHSSPLAEIACELSVSSASTRHRPLSRRTGDGCNSTRSSHRRTKQVMSARSHDRLPLKLTVPVEFKLSTPRTQGKAAESTCDDPHHEWEESLRHTKKTPRAPSTSSRCPSRCSSRQSSPASERYCTHGSRTSRHEPGRKATSRAASRCSSRCSSPGRDGDTNLLLKGISCKDRSEPSSPARSMCSYRSTTASLHRAPGVSHCGSVPSLSSLSTGSAVELSTESRLSRLSRRTQSRRHLSSEELLQLHLAQKRAQVKQMMKKNQTSCHRAIYYPDASSNLSVASRSSCVTVPKEFNLSTPSTPRSSRDHPKTSKGIWEGALRKPGAQGRSSAESRQAWRPTLNVSQQSKACSQRAHGSHSREPSPCLSSSSKARFHSADSGKLADTSLQPATPRLQLSSSQLEQIEIAKKKREVQASMKYNQEHYRKAVYCPDTPDKATSKNPPSLTVPSGPTLHTPYRSSSRSRCRSQTNSPERSTHTKREGENATKISAIAKQRSQAACVGHKPCGRRPQHGGARSAAEERAERARSAAEAKCLEAASRGHASLCVFRRPGGSLTNLNRKHH